MRKIRNFWSFIALAVLGGFIGLQEFYADRWVLGILAIIFCWTCIPALVAYIEAIVWLFRGETSFNIKFNGQDRDRQIINEDMKS